jgi:hypothetical protein
VNEELYALLSAIKPTYHMEMPSGVSEGIVYQLAYAADTAYETGQPLAETYTYRITIYQDTYNGAMISAVCSALRAAGWAIQSREQLKQQDGTTDYYQHVIDVAKRRLITA